MILIWPWSLTMITPVPAVILTLALHIIFKEDQRQGMKKLQVVGRLGRGWKKNDEDQPIYTRLPTDTRTISGLLSHLKPKLKSQPYDSIASNRIVHAALTLQLEYCRELVKKGGVKPPAPKIRHKVCQMFAISPITYSKIMNAFLEKDAQPYKTGARGGGETESRIPQTKRTVISIRAFIREQRAKKMRTTAVQVLEHCRQEGFIDQLDPDVRITRRNMRLKSEQLKGG